MVYSEIVMLVFLIITVILCVLTLPFMIFSLIGLFTHKKFPKTDKKLKYGIIIPARNEENVVGNLIKSIMESDYPKENLQIFVIAHNCTDKTAEIARNAGATVFEYNNLDEQTMGYAIRHGFDKIKEAGLIQAFDGFVMFNADNLIRKNYFDKMNDAFVYYDCKKVVTSFRNSKNTGANVIAGLYCMFFASGCALEMEGRTFCNVSTRVGGTGYIISSELVKDGWPYVTLTEDWEFSADQVLRGNTIAYCEEAEFFDEQPTTLKVLWRQRIRWARGHLLVFFTRFKDLLRALFSKKYSLKQKVSLYDMSINVSPIVIFSTFLFAFEVILLAFAPLVEGVDMGVGALLAFLKHFGISALCTYIILVLSGALIFLRERKRIDYTLANRKHKVGLKIILCLLWPLMIFVEIPISLVALFSKNLSWKSIPHTNSISLGQEQADVNYAEQTTESEEEKSVDEQESDSKDSEQELQEQNNIKIVKFENNSIKNAKKIKININCTKKLVLQQDKQ